MTQKEKILDTLMDIRFASANTFYSRRAKTLKGAILRPAILLNRYCKEGFIKEVEFDDEPRNKRREQFYTITEKGAAFIDRPYKTLKYKAKRFIKHQSMISDLAMSFKYLYPYKFDFNYGRTRGELRADIDIGIPELKYYFFLEAERKDDAPLWSINGKAEKFVKLKYHGKCLFVYLPRECNPYLRPMEYTEKYAREDVLTAQRKFIQLIRHPKLKLPSPSRFLLLNFYDHYRLNEAVWYGLDNMPRKLIQ